ncbi:hypothetical protein [Streptomyces sp. NPDC005244]
MAARDADELRRRRKWGSAAIAVFTVPPNMVAMASSKARLSRDATGAT